MKQARSIKKILSGRHIGGLITVFFLLLPALLGAEEPAFKPDDFKPRLSPQSPDAVGQVETIIEKTPPITILADEIEHDEARDLTNFIGRVRLFRGAEAVAADRAVWHNATGSAELSGAVRMETPDFTILSERAAVNMDRSLAKIYRGRAFFPRGHYYVNGEIIERLNDKELSLAEAEASTCDGPEKAWSLQASRLRVTENGYASAVGAVFKANGGSAPLLASPYFIFPVKTDRQTGFLSPSFGVSSRDGTLVSLPFFWATGESHDLTLNPVWREKRGLTSHLEGRYSLNWGRGLWQISHLNDKEERGYAQARLDGPNSGRQTVRERFWLRSQNQGRLGEWDMNLNLDLASDPLYLREFATAPEGFNQSFAAFGKNFGYAPNEASNPNRDNEFYLQKNMGDAHFRAGLHYTQNLGRARNLDVVQRLPSLQYDLVGRSLGGETAAPRLYLKTRYDYFHRLSDENSDTDETGHRFRFGPNLEWTRTLGGLFNLKATGGLDFTAYAADGRRPGLAPNPEDLRHDAWNSRLTGAAELELSTSFNRVFQGGPGRALAFRHQLTPVVGFNYVQAQNDQGRLPYWDQFDRRLPRRTFRYGLLNALVSKTARPAANDRPDELEYDYFQFLKFNLSSSYEFADNRRLTDDRLERYYDLNYYGKGQGPLEAELEAFFSPWVSARLFSAYAPGAGRASRHDFSLNMNDGRGDRLTLTYDYGSPEEATFGLNSGADAAASHKEARATLDLTFNSEWSASFYTRFNLKNDQAMESTARLAYKAQCYGLQLIYAKTYSDESVGLMIDLLGLGSTGFNVGDVVGNALN